MKREKVSWAELKLDCYAGDNADEVYRYWETYSVDDKDSDISDKEVLELSLKYFPPGTQIIIMEPYCPECDLPRYGTLSVKTGQTEYHKKCPCGFNWEEWELNEYS